MLADDTYGVVNETVHRRIAFSDPGIDDFRNELLWSPERPTLIQAEVELWRGDRCLDRVESYTALRSVGVQGDRFLLNGRPYYLRLVLDQGYWPDTLMTAPDDDALRRDVELTKAMGFNGVRKHQKIEDPRYLYWADRLGLLVWEEMPSAYRFTPKAVERIEREWEAVIARDQNHPCVVGLGARSTSRGGSPASASGPSTRATSARSTTSRRRSTPRAPSSATTAGRTPRPTCSPSTTTTRAPRGSRRATARTSPRLTSSGGTSRPGGGSRSRASATPTSPSCSPSSAGSPSPRRRDAWGYAVAPDAETFFQRYGALLTTVRRLSLFCGFCYTQLTDTFQEANGLLTMDRRPKVPVELIAAVTQGPPGERPEVLWAAAHGGEGSAEGAAD